MSAKDSPVFIIGIARCGSKIYRHILMQDNNLHISKEVHFRMPWFMNRPVHRLIKSKTTLRKKLTQLISDKQKSPAFFASCKIPFETLVNVFENRPKTAPKNILQNLLTLDAAQFNKQRTGAVFPVNIAYANWLFTHFAQSTFLHITRDPRAVYSSMILKDYSFQKANSKLQKFGIRVLRFLYLIHQYNWQSKVHTRCQHNPNYRLYRYEELITHPESSVDDICTHAGIEFQNAMLHPPQILSSYQPKGKKRFGWYTTSLGRWVHEISKFELLLLRIFLSKAARNLGYRI